MADPELLLLEEPSLGLAPLIVDELFGRLVDLNKRHGLTVVLPEQNIDNALAIADRGYIFEVGKIVITDTAERLRGRLDIEDMYLGWRTFNNGRSDWKCISRFLPSFKGPLFVYVNEQGSTKCLCEGH